ncbi:hypothetical protein [Chitiniphilus shinanonensis]|uniref:hypothetical protein n=1 Tax=Chitiniphilus shinanonensis TaxID=553088 RepID=UPI00035F7897|nr:hypothetical protein [Chitiniphilus shinanonensis]
MMAEIYAKVFPLGFVLAFLYIACVFYFRFKIRALRDYTPWNQVLWVLGRKAAQGDAGEEINAPLWLRWMFYCAFAVFAFLLVMGLKISFP